MTKPAVNDCFRADSPRLSHDGAIALLKRAALTLATPTTISVPLSKASDRVLADRVRAEFAVPAHTNSAVDGYAFLSTPEIAAKGAIVPVYGRATAGHPSERHGLPRPMDAAVRIFTGAVVPAGLNTVAMQEDCELGGEIPEHVRLPQGLKSGANVRKAGEDVALGEVVFEPGHRVRPQDLAALASLGHGEVRCRERIKVAIVSTGDEIRAPGSGPLPHGQVYDANSPMLAALVAQAGADITQLALWPDQRAEIIANLGEVARVADVIITTGGASLGDEDHVAAALAEIGTRHLWQIAVKPGRPMMFGQINTGDRSTIVIGLPGNPVAVFVCFLMYVYPLLRALGGSQWPEPRRFMLPAAFNFTGRKTGRREFWRARMIQTQTGMAVEKFTRDGSGLISSLRWSDGLIDIPEHHGDIKHGDPVAFIPFSEFGIL